MRILIGLIAAAVVLPAPAAAAPDAAEKPVCKTERFVGSRISSRVCKTRAEWEEGASAQRKRSIMSATRASMRAPRRPAQEAAAVCLDGAADSVSALSVVGFTL